MNVAILSGKGGAGKTFLAVNLAYVAAGSTYCDADVEEPNGHIFLRPEITERKTITAMIPAVRQEKCTGCMDCVEFCEYNALAYVPGELLVFPEICHSCGGCVLICPEGALEEAEKEIGEVEAGVAGKVGYLAGRMKVREASGVPLIKEILARQSEGDMIIDCPPGSSCLAIESIRTADFCLLVLEPTPFGLHNFRIVYELVKLFGKRFAAVLNKVEGVHPPSQEFCRRNDIEILSEIPFDKELAYRNSRGEIVATEEKYAALFSGLWQRIKERGKE